MDNLQKGFFSLFIGLALLISTLIFSMSTTVYSIIILLSIVFSVTATAMFFKRITDKRMSEVRNSFKQQR